MQQSIAFFLHQFLREPREAQSGRYYVDALHLARTASHSARLTSSTIGSGKPDSLIPPVLASSAPWLTNRMQRRIAVERSEGDPSSMAGPNCDQSSSSGGAKRRFVMRSRYEASSGHSSRVGRTATASVMSERTVVSRNRTTNDPEPRALHHGRVEGTLAASDHSTT